MSAPSIPPPTAPIDVRDIVDVDRYPITSRTTWARHRLLEECWQQMDDRGACELPGFIDHAVLDDLVAEAHAAARRAHRSEERVTPYLTTPEAPATASNPRARLSVASHAVVPADDLPDGGLLTWLYRSEDLLEFIRLVLRRERLYRYACPLGRINLAVMRDGDTSPWHFDLCEFVTSVALQSSTSGGDFEVVPRIRSDDDGNDAGVIAVLDGDRSRVQQIAMVPGTLLVFEGRHSLHRVTPVGGPVERHVALLAFDTTPDATSSASLRRGRYGRTEARVSP